MTDDRDALSAGWDDPLEFGRRLEAARAAVAAALARDFPGNPGVSPHSFFDEAPVSWERDGQVLKWHVALVAVDRATISVDQLDDAFLVRARCESAATGWVGAVLPVPPGWDRGSATARFDGAMLELSVHP